MGLALDYQFPTPVLHKTLVYIATLGICTVLFVLMGCSGNSNAAEDTAPTDDPLPTSTVTPLALAQTPPVPSAETPETAFNLVIWWPEPIDPVDRPEVTALLNQQIEAFNSAEEGEINIEFRLKRAQDIGGIISTLRTASPVAPGALPDLTLLRREDLVFAADNNLIYPMEGLIPSAIVGNLYDSALALGQFEGQIYGLPYLLSVRHLAYRPEDGTAMPTWSFEDVLTQEMQWLFPIGRLSGIVDTLYVQYIDAGGTPPNNNGTFTLNEEALLTLLSFYENAYTLGLFDEQSTEILTTGDYLPDLELGTINAGVVDATTFFALNAEDETLLPASIPSASGETIGIVNGWMWALTTTNADQQELAARFMNWMMDVERQSAFARTIAMLPSRRTSIDRVSDDLPGIDVMDTILSNSQPILPIAASSELASTLQSAVIRILRGEATAAAITAELMSELTE